MAYHPSSNRKYDDSNLKIVIDAWADDKFKNNELKEILGYKARLIKHEEYNNISDGNTWKYGDYIYWAYSSVAGWNMPIIYSDGRAIMYPRDRSNHLVRPVINVYKSAIEDQ